MKISPILTINAAIFVALGIGFTLYGPNILAYFGVSDLAGDNFLLYWNVVAFARMFGAMLLSCGLILWAIRGIFDDTTDKAQVCQEILFSLVLGFLIAAVAAITQVSSVWGSIAGWVLSGLFLVCTLVYIPFLIRKAA
jgi:predicted membrane-bound spermidine synthase